MRSFVAILASMGLVLSAFSQGWGQLLLEENFDYPAGNNLTDHGWSEVQGGTDVSVVAASGLSYTGYASSGFGNAALLDENGGGGHEDLGRAFTAQTTGDVYVSFLIHASAVDLTASFNFPLYLTQAVGAGAWGRVSIDINGSSQVSFGLAQFTEVPVSTPFSYALNTTYLIVLKYTINPGATNDQATLFVFTDPTLPAGEPVTPTLGPVASNQTDPAEITRVVIRRAAASNNNILLDGIRVSTSWTEAPLPVELVSFTSAVRRNAVTLEWTTASETNNYGFEVERQRETADWERVGFVEGHGTTSEARRYSYVDAGLLAGRYRYRLKQVDTDGQFEYSGILNVTVGGPLTTRLAQNYPNPFNPSTNIIYSIAEPELVQLRIFDTAGRTVRTLINDTPPPGEYSVIWDGRNDRGRQVASGLYFYALKIGSQTTAAKRMLLIK